jgi:uncharacterized phiE125 gp8 family phage protein
VIGCGHLAAHLMGVTWNGFTDCTDSHADDFIHNRVTCRDSARSGGYASAVRIPDGSPAPDEPITLEEAKAHIRYDTEQSAEDDLVRSWIRSARQKVERDTGVVLVVGTYRITVDQYPIFRLPLILPVWPVQSIDAVAHYDRAGALQSEGSPSPYVFLSSGRPHKLALTDDLSWPTDVRTYQPGVIDVTAGYASPSLVPDDLKQAVKLLVAQSASFREPMIAGQGIASVGIDYDRWIETWVLPSA